MTLKHFVEEYFDSHMMRPTKEVYEIFKNPTPKELNSIGNRGVRILLDKKKKDIYVFHENLLHYEVIRKITLDKEEFSSDRFVHAYGIIKKGKLFAERSPPRVRKKEYETFKKYISGYC